MFFAGRKGLSDIFKLRLWSYFIWNSMTYSLWVYFFHIYNFQYFPVISSLWRIRNQWHTGFEEGPTLDGAVSWTRGTWPPSFNGQKPSSQLRSCLRKLFSPRTLNDSMMTVYACGCTMSVILHFLCCFINEIYLLNASTYDKVWGSREVDKNSVPTGVGTHQSMSETLRYHAVFQTNELKPGKIRMRNDKPCYPTQIQERSIKLFHERWNQLPQDNGRSHALEGWTERTWKHNKDLLAAQDGFRTVSNWQLHVYASWVLT